MITKQFIPLLGRSIGDQLIADTTMSYSLNWAIVGTEIDTEIDGEESLADLKKPVKQMDNLYCNKLQVRHVTKNRGYPRIVR